MKKKPVSSQTDVKLPSLPPYNPPVKPMTKDHPLFKIKKENCLVDEKLETYHELRRINHYRVKKLEALLIEKKEEVVSKISAHDKLYKPDTRPYLTALQKIEDNIMEDYYSCYQEEFQNYRLYCERYVKLLTDRSTATQFKAAMMKDQKIELFGKNIKSRTESEPGDFWVSNSEVYKIKNQEIGSSSLGKVFYCMANGTQIAIKEFSERITKDLIFTESRVRVDVQNFYKKLKHPHINQVIGACFTEATKEDPAYFGLLSEFAVNGSLYDCLHKKFPRVQVSFSLSKKLQIISEIVAGMEFLYSFEPPVYHLNLKSTNILLDASYSVRIADSADLFVAMNKLYVEKRTRKKAYLIVYLAPEILSGEYNRMNENGDKADVYSFGILMNELLTEEAPELPNISIDEYKTRVTRGDRPKLFEKKMILKEIILNCWKSNPEERPTFKELNTHKKWEEAKTDNPKENEKYFDNILAGFKIQNTTEVCGLIIKNFSEMYDSTRLGIREGKTEAILHNDYVHINVFVQALGCNKKEDKVSIENVRRVLQWIQNLPKFDVVSTLYTVFSSEYFYGIMDDAQAINILQQSKPGTYMVRFSPSKEKFLFEYIPKKKKNSNEEVSIQPLTEELPVVHLDQLDKAVNSTLFQLRIKKIATCGNRPKTLVDKIIPHLMNLPDYHYSLEDKQYNTPGYTRVKELNRVTQSHYVFI